MTNKNDPMNIPETTSAHEPEADTSRDTDSGKMKFVEPELSSAVSVLEVTTFLQAIESGPTT